MKLLRFRRAGRDQLGLLQGREVVDLNAAAAYQARHGGAGPARAFPSFPADLPQLLVQPAWQEAVQAVATFVKGVPAETRRRLPFLFPVERATLLSPIARPGKIVCVGLNYPAPGEDRGAAPPYPILFHKVASAIVGSGAAIRLPAIGKEVLYEGELAVVVGKAARNVPGERALDYVAGYTIANDVGARDVEQRSSQWTSGKMFDTFCPLGPVFLAAAAVPDPSRLRIRTRLNDELVQDAPTATMFYDVPALLSYISTLTTLEPGDLILTGSPKSAGDEPDPRRPLQPGDTIAVHIEPIGVLQNRVSAANP